jgi:hypothetical protein
MGSIPSRFTCRRQRLLLPGLWCGLVLLCGVVSAQNEPPAGEAPEEGSQPAPRLVVESKEIDLGQLVRGESAEASFALRNEGDAVLRILRAKPG